MGHSGIAVASQDLLCASGERVNELRLTNGRRRGKLAGGLWQLIEFDHAE